jgi:septal ring factor EnvC (AmiA/AmiB activator)
MKYVQNNGRYAVAFELTKNGRPFKLVLDRKRIYMDTGNIATTGITEVEDDVYKLLSSNKRFKQMLETKEMELTEASKIETAETKVKALEEENKKLKAQIASSGKNEDSNKTKALEEENNKLKAQLEALGKKKTAKAEKDEAEGF